MTQDDQFHQYGYDHYLKAPKGKTAGVIRPRRKSAKEKFMARFENPVFATIALLSVGVIFAGVLVMSYPSGPDDEKDIPIVTADLRPVKVQPGSRGGMKVPYSDSTVLSDVGRDSDGWERDPGVENLLASVEETLASKEEELARATENALPVGVSTADKGLGKGEAQESKKQQADPAILLQKIEKPSADVSAQNESAESDERPKLHAAATSPETIDFVKSVLDKDEKPDQEAAKAVSAPKTVPPKEAPAKIARVPAADILSKIEPAAGAASPAVDLVKGTYYVQLASIKVRDRADGEWKKFQAKYAPLMRADYRVQAANLGERGVFYRIQAGPFSKAQANKICDSIKAQKPGGCLVVK